MPYDAQQRANAIRTVIDGLSVGTPLTVLCRAEGMPSTDTIYAWAADDEALAAAISAARDAGFDAIAQRIRLTVRGMGPEDGGESSGSWQRDKLIAETDLKLLAKWDPKRYGDRIAVAGDKDAPLHLVISLEDASL